MTVVEAQKIHEQELKEADDLYADGTINMLELAALKEEIDSEYRKNLSEAK